MNTWEHVAILAKVTVGFFNVCRRQASQSVLPAGGVAIAFQICLSRTLSKVPFAAVFHSLRKRLS